MNPADSSKGRGQHRGERARDGAPREAEVPAADGIAGWFAGRLPDEWFEGAAKVSVDRD